MERGARLRWFEGQRPEGTAEEATLETGRYGQGGSWRRGSPSSSGRGQQAEAGEQQALPGARPPPPPFPPPPCLLQAWLPSAWPTSSTSGPSASRP